MPANLATRAQRRDPANRGRDHAAGAAGRGRHHAAGEVRGRSGDGQGVTEQRQAVIRDLEAQTSKAGIVIGDVRGVVKGAHRRGRPVGQCRDRPDDRRRRAIDPPRTLRYAFALAVALVLITLASLLCYRLAVRRWAPRNEALLEPSRALGIEGMPR